MAVITFWSNSNKQTSQTMSLVAIATSMAIEHNYRILLISTQYNDNTLELCFGEATSKQWIKNLTQNGIVAVDNGIEGLAKVANGSRLTPEIIQNYTRIIYKNRLEIITSYKEDKSKSSEDEYLKIKEKYKAIIQNASKFYDMVFVDLNKGTQDKMVRDILEISDVVVYSVEQKMYQINDFIANDFATGKNVILNIGRYDNNSKYNITNISRYVGLKKDIIVIPYNTLYFEAANENKVADLFLNIRKVSDADINSVFVKKVQNAVKTIIYKVQEVQMRM